MNWVRILRRYLFLKMTDLGLATTTTGCCKWGLYYITSIELEAFTDVSLTMTYFKVIGE